jgi:CRISPR-associated protein Csb2
MDVDSGLTRALRHYVRRRNHGGVSPFADIGIGLRLTFSEPLYGPLMLGYASHYGLGLFRWPDENCVY